MFKIPHFATKKTFKKAIKCLGKLTDTIFYKFECKNGINVNSDEYNLPLSKNGSLW